MRTSIANRTGATILFAASLAALLLAFYAYFTPLTGVEGSLGALIVIIACVVLAVAAVVLPALHIRGWRNLLRGLVLLGLVGTAFAGALLHRWFIPVAMAVGLIGLILDMMHRARAVPATRAKE